MAESRNDVMIKSIKVFPYYADLNLNHGYFSEKENFYIITSGYIAHYCS